MLSVINNNLHSDFREPACEQEVIIVMAEKHFNRKYT